MAHSEIWDATYEAEPSNTDDASGGAGEFRDLKRNIRERAEVDHDWDDVNNAGKHNQVTLQRAAVKPTLSGTDGAVYAKDDGSGNTEAFFEDDSGNEVQLTEGGAAAPSAVQKTGDEMTGDLDMSGADLKLDNDQSLLGDVAATGSYENLIKRNASDQVEVGNTSGEVLIKGDDVNGLQFDEGAGPFEIFHRGNVEYFNSGELAIPNQYTRATTAHGLSGIMGNRPLRRRKRTVWSPGRFRSGCALLQLIRDPGLAPIPGTEH